MYDDFEHKYSNDCDDEQENKYQRNAYGERVLPEKCAFYGNVHTALETAQQGIHAVAHKQNRQQDTYGKEAAVTGVHDVLQYFFYGIIGVGRNVIGHEHQEIVLEALYGNVGYEVKQKEQEREQGHEEAKRDGTRTVRYIAIDYARDVQLQQVIQRKPFGIRQLYTFANADKVFDYGNALQLMFQFNRH